MIYNYHKRIKEYIKMNVLFFIGNGFDLNVGLKTRFGDVLFFI